MDLNGEYRIPAARKDVWEALNDPEVLKQCIDGCEELSKDSDTQFSAKVTAKVGPVKAKFSGKVAKNSFLISVKKWSITLSGSLKLIKSEILFTGFGL